MNGTETMSSYSGLYLIKELASDAASLGYPLIHISSYIKS